MSNSPHLNEAEKLVVDGALAGNAAHFISAGQDPNRTKFDREGGIFPRPVARTPVEGVSFLAGSLTLNWVIMHFLIIPFLAVYAAIVSIPVAYFMAWREYHPEQMSLHTAHTLVGLWVIAALIILFFIGRKFARAVYGRKRKLGSTTVLPATVQQPTIPLPVPQIHQR